MLDVPASLFLEGRTLRPRHEAIPLVTDALTRCGVLLEDFREHPEQVMAYHFEIEREQVVVLAALVIEAGFTLEGDDPAEASATIEADDDGFVRATLRLTFSTAEDHGDDASPTPE